MSTKTSFKRIALVAVAGLVSGLVSVAPANAAVSAAFNFVTAESSSNTTDTAVHVAGLSNYIEIQAVADTAGATRISLTGAGATFVDITELVAGVGGTPVDPAATVSYNTAATVATTSSGDLYGSAATTSIGAIKLRVATTTAGTVTIKVDTISVSAGIETATDAGTLTVTVNSAASAGTLSVTNSTSLLDAEATAAGSYSAPTADETVNAAKAAGTVAGVAKLTLLDVNSGNMPNTTSVTATVSGPGLVSVNSTLASATRATAGRDVSGTTSSGVIYAAFYADGAEGTSVITFKVGTTVVATETVKYYGAPTKYTATTQIVALANTTASTDAVLVCATDAAGIAVPGSTIYAYSGDTTVATVEANDDTEATAIATSGTSYADHVAATAVGCVGFTVTGLAQTTKSSVVITFGNAATLATSTVTTTATVNVGLALADSVALTANKTTYLPGEAMTLTLTFKDANGRLIAYGPGTAVLAGELVSSVSTVGTKFAANTIAKLGTATATVYAPLTSGPLTISGTTASSAGSYLTALNTSKAISATVTVSDSATMSALTTLINSLIAKINALNKLVIKIQKKVKA